MGHTSPPSKRIKLEPQSDDGEVYKPEPPPDQVPEDDDLDEEHCSICLQPLSDRTIIPACSHEFCFECLLIWTEQSRRCPLCSGPAGEYLIHNIRSKYDYSKHYLTPLRTSPRPEPPLARVPGIHRQTRRRDVRWGVDQRRERERELREADELERAIEKRRWIYRHDLYAKHVASNSYTRYRPYPTPAQFASNPDLISRATIFVRRELRAWDALDVEFLTTFIISLMKSIDIRSESAVKLLAEFLDMDTAERVNAEHFAHELYCYLRSPYRDLVRYDAVVQYDSLEHVPPLHHRTRTRRWEDAREFPRGVSPGPSRLSLRPRSRSGTRGIPARQRDHSVGRSEIREPRNAGRDSRADKRSDPRSRSRTSDHVDIDVDVKGKRRAVENGVLDNITSITDRASDVDAAKAKGTSSADRGRQDSTGVTSTNPTTPPRRSTSPVSLAHDVSVVDRPNPLVGLSDRPRVRRDALQAIGVHLAHASTERSAPGSKWSHPQDTLIERSAGHPITRVEGIAIRGAAKATTPVPSVPSNSSTEPSREPNDQPLTHVPRNPTQGMSSREIMARTRARLATLRENPTLSAAISSERGDHDAVSMDDPRAIVELGSPPVAGNQTVPRGSSPPFNPITSDVADNSAAQSSSTDSLSHSDKPHAPSALRAKLFSKLDNEKRAYNEQKTPSGREGAATLPVDINDTHAESTLLPAVHETQLRGPSGGGSLFRRDTEMLENSLRAQAQLRVKLAAAKRSLADAGAEDMSNVDVDLVTREGHLRSQLRRGA